MFFTKSLKTYQLIVCRQKRLNWCQFVANRRYLSEDNKDNDNQMDDKPDVKTDVECVDQKSDLIESRRPENRVIKAKESLNQLIQTLKSKEVLGDSDDKLKEILAKPVSHVRQSARKEEDFNTKDEEINEISDRIDERLVMAAKGIAKTLSGEESKRTENDLLRLLKIQVIETNLAKQGKGMSNEDLAALLGDMKVMKREPLVDRQDRQYATNQKPVRNAFNENYRKAPTFERKPFREDERMPWNRGKRDGMEREYRLVGPQTVSESLLRASGERINLFDGNVSLDLFDADMKESSDSPKMLLWNRFMDDECESTVAHPPRNAFEEMIKWTEEGKLWRYPINNEQGLEEEENVPFYEHVLLDHLLEGLPQRGPVRKFMELVIIGLSSNPYITVDRKHATVKYYKEYFAEKEDILKIAGALD